MTRNFSPTVSERREPRSEKKEGTRKVILNRDEIDIAWLNQFLGKIFFWSFSVTKVLPNTYATKFRVYTKRYIPPEDLFKTVEGEFPDGCKVTLCRPYGWRHTFDVKTANPLMWRVFIMRICKALEGLLL